MRSLSISRLRKFLVGGREYRVILMFIKAPVRPPSVGRRRQGLGGRQADHRAQDRKVAKSRDSALSYRRDRGRLRLLHGPVQNGYGNVNCPTLEDLSGNASPFRADVFRKGTAGGG